jgi:hypothetical protein
MKRFVWAGFAAGVLLVILPHAASSGGGNWIETDPRLVGVGDTVTARATFSASRERTEALGPYYAYLAPDPATYELPDPEDVETILLGGVEVLWPEDHEWRGMLRHNPRASITFTAPEVPAGSHILVFCDLACERPLGDIDITYLNVAATGEEARLQYRLAVARGNARSLETRLRIQRERQEQMDAYFERTGDRVRVAEREAHELGGEVDRLQEIVVSLSAARNRERWILGGAMVVVLGAAALVKVRAVKRRRRVSVAVNRVLRETPVETAHEEWRLIDN